MTNLIFVRCLFPTLNCICGNQQKSQPNTHAHMQRTTSSTTILALFCISLSFAVRWWDERYRRPSTSGRSQHVNKTLISDTLWSCCCWCCGYATTWTSSHGSAFLFASARSHTLVIACLCEWANTSHVCGCSVQISINKLYWGTSACSTCQFRRNQLEFQASQTSTSTATAKLLIFLRYLWMNYKKRTRKKKLFFFKFLFRFFAVCDSHSDSTLEEWQKCIFDSSFQFNSIFVVVVGSVPLTERVIYFIFQSSICVLLNRSCFFFLFLHLKINWIASFSNCLLFHSDVRSVVNWFFFYFVRLFGRTRFHWKCANEFPWIETNKNGKNTLFFNFNPNFGVRGMWVQFFWTFSTWISTFISVSYALIFASSFVPFFLFFNFFKFFVVDFAVNVCWRLLFFFCLRFCFPSFVFASPRAN